MWDFGKCSFHQHHDLTRGESWNDDLWLELDIFTRSSQMIKAKLSLAETGPSPWSQCAYNPGPFCTEESLWDQGSSEPVLMFHILFPLFCILWLSGRLCARDGGDKRREIPGRFHGAEPHATP